MQDENNDVKRLYDATDGGLRIILDYCQEAKYDDKLGGKNQPKFAIRGGDATPSAHLFKDDGMDCWYVKDFGGGSMDPIDVYCKSTNKSRQNDFHNVITSLMNAYGVPRQNGTSSDGRVWEENYEKAPEGAMEGWCIREHRELTDDEIAILSRKADRDIINELKWYAVERMGYVKNGSIKYVHSSKEYPIFERRCDFKDGERPTCYWKHYEPKAPLFTDKNGNKRAKFKTFGANGETRDVKKPSDYMNNLQEFIDGYKKKLAEADDDKKEMPSIYTQGVVICSGERDAVACRSLGWWPIWANSETAVISEYDIRKLRSTDKDLPIYYIPDLDETGQKYRNIVANRYPYIYIVNLPQSIKQKKDRRGKPMKDLRDWVEVTKDMNAWKFSQFMETAVRVQFWNISYTKNGDKKVTLDTSCLHFLLESNGYAPVQDEDVDGGVEFGHRLNNYTIEAVDNKKVKDFVLTWCADNLVANIVRNQLMDGVKLQEASLMNMVTQEYNFVQHDENSQKMYFKNCMITITKEGVKISEMSDENKSGSMIWKKTVIDRNFRRVLKDGEQLFRIRRYVDPDSNEQRLSIDIKEEAYKSKAFSVLCATSHIYWQEEQKKLEKEGYTKEQIEEYWKTHYNRLDFEYLTEDQKYEQFASLISKLFIIGYYGWDFNSAATPWSAFVMDDFDGEGSNGGSGKSLLFDYIGQYKEVVTIDGRRKDKDKDKHIFAAVSPRTRVINFDDFVGDFAAWYKHISSGVTVEKKGVDPYTIPPEKSPKLAFTSNYVNDRQGSSRRRQILTTCSSFFHSEGGAFDNQSSPSDYVGTLWSVQYTTEDWQYDDNIFVNCIEEAMPYIQQGIKLEPPMERAEIRKLHNLIGRQSINFFDEYFCLGENTHANKTIPRIEILEEYKKYVSEDRRRNVADGDILEKCAMWCKYRSWVMGYCPFGVGGQVDRKGAKEGKYNTSRIIMQNPDKMRYGTSETLEGIYVATIDNKDEKLQYLRDASPAYKEQREEIEEEIEKAMENPDESF